ncbi:MAG: RecX family transcriptional regulator [Chloroflexi bacterium]|nr:RecX family transcriptional regulator [Chloroflexota bacterium]
MESKITALKAQKRDPSRINVYLNGKFAFGIDRLVGAWLTVGQVMDAEKIEKLVQADTLEKAYQKALNFLGYRVRSEAEIRQKLHEAGYDEELIDHVITRLLNSRLAGDSAFAQNWIENRSNFRPRSRRMLRMELRQKGVEESVIDEALENAPDETEMARKVGQKYANRLHDADKVVFCKKMTDYLLRKGFDFSIARDLAMQLWVENKEESDIPLRLVNNEENDNDY